MQNVRQTQSASILPACLWRYLPLDICDAVQSCGDKTVEEIRLYHGRISQARTSKRSHSLGIVLNREQLQEILVSMCHGSLYAHAETLKEGYLTLEGGIRVGVAGHAAIENGKIIGIKSPDSLVIRIPHTITVDATAAVSRLFADGQVGSLLILAPPGVGKTTLLRAIAEQAASPPLSRQTVLVDTRGELCYGLGNHHLSLHTLSGHPREIGIEIAVRSLGAELIICDEIGSDADARAILHATNCGVPLAASAHAASVKEALRRPALSELHHAHVFAHYVELSRVDCQLAYRFFSWQEADRLQKGGNGHAF